jgi:hypothetical protein
MKTKEIENGWILLTSAKTFTSEVIQMFEGCVWSHSAWLFWEDGILKVIGADIEGVRITPFENWLDDAGRTFLIVQPTFAFDFDELIRLAKTYDGVKYDFFNLVVSQSINIITERRFWIGHSKTYTKQFICGAFVWFCMAKQFPEYFGTWQDMRPDNIFELPFNHFQLEGYTN